MLVYLINICLILLWAVPLLKINPTQKKKKIYCGIVALQWILISGLRHWSVGADTYAYYERFEVVKTFSWDYLLSNSWDYLFNGASVKDPAYDLLVKAFQTISGDYQVFLIFIATVFTVLMARWVYKYSSLPELSFIVYSVLFYAFYSVTGHRQTLATALIVFLGYECAKERKPIKFAILAFVAFMLHKSSLVFIPYYFIANIALTPAYIGIVAVVIALLFVMGDAIYAPVAFFLGFGEEQIYYEGGGTSTFVFLMLAVCIATISFHLWISKRREDSRFMYNLIFLTLASTLLVIHQQSFMRVQQYYSMVIMLTIPELVLSIKKQYQPIVYFIGIAIMLAFLISVNPYYKFYFM